MTNYTFPLTLLVHSFTGTPLLSKLLAVSHSPAPWSGNFTWHELWFINQSSHCACKPLEQVWLATSVAVFNDHEQLFWSRPLTLLINYPPLTDIFCSVSPAWLDQPQSIRMCTGWPNLEGIKVWAVSSLTSHWNQGWHVCHWLLVGTLSTHHEAIAMQWQRNSLRSSDHLQTTAAFSVTVSH